MDPNNQPQQPEEPRQPQGTEDDASKNRNFTPAPDTVVPENRQFDAATVTPSPTSQKLSSKKKVLLGALIAVVIVTVGAISVFSLWYNKPQNVVGNSLMKMLSATSSEGVISISTPENGIAGNVAASFAQNEAGELSGIVQVSTAGQIKDSDIKTSYALDRDRTVYLKFDNLKSTIDELSKNDGSGAVYLSLFGGIVDAVEGKWISLREEDIQSLVGQQSDNSELSCALDKVSTFRSNQDQQRQIVDLYTKHPFINVSQVGTETVNGVYSNHYRLTPDEGVAKEFMSGVKDLAVFKAVDDCVRDNLANQLDESIRTQKPATNESTQDTYDYWVGVWSHDPVKFAVTTEESGKKSTLEIMPKLNTNPTVTIPKADKSISELQQELFSSYDDMIEPQPLPLGDL